jgi:hypothetical protein
MSREATRKRVHLNGVELALGPNDELPEFKPEATARGAMSLAPETFTFLAISNAANAADDGRGFRNAAGDAVLTTSPPEPDTNEGAQGPP